MGQEVARSVSSPSRCCRDERCPAGAVIGYRSPRESLENDDPTKGVGDPKGKRGPSLGTIAESGRQKTTLGTMICQVNTGNPRPKGDGGEGRGVDSNSGRPLVRGNQDLRSASPFRLILQLLQSACLQIT